jgi:hypothetical protein
MFAGVIFLAPSVLKKKYVRETDIMNKNINIYMLKRW